MDNKLRLANCIQCGCLFVKGSSSLCQRCLQDSNSEIELLCNLFENVPSISLDSALSITAITNERFVKIAQTGKLRHFNNIKVNCRICKMPLPASYGRALCNSCYSEMFNNSGSSERINKLRRELKVKQKAHKLKIRLKAQKEKNSIKPFRFTKALREHFAKYINSYEPEVLPGLSGVNTLKLSGPFGFIKPTIKTC